MKQIKGVVNIHGENIEVDTRNNIQCATIEGISTYDIYSYLKEQDKDLKVDLIQELYKELDGVSKTQLMDWMATLLKKN